MHKQSIILVLITAFFACSFWPIQAAKPTLHNGSLLPQNAIFIEAETAVQKDNGVEIVKKEGASGGAAVICRPAAKAFYQVDFSNAGTWYVWVRLFCPNSDADSYWIGIDNAEPVPLDNAGNGDIGVRFYADPGDSVNSNQSHQIWYWDGGKGVKDPKNHFIVKKPGKTRLWVKGREAGTIIDSILLTTDKDFNPETTLKGGAVNPVSPVVAKTPAVIAAPVNRPKNNTEIFLWNGKAPGSENSILTETYQDRSNNPNEPNRVVSGISKPSIIPFFPEKPNGISVLIMPGGGYSQLVFDREGIEVAKWLNTMGITGFVLKYRLIREKHLNSQMVALQDAQRALRLIRKNAAGWGISPNKIGVIGFSAGGHLAATLGTHFNLSVYKTADAVDSASARPDFMTLVYPGINNIDQYVTKDTPKTFIVIGDSDLSVSPQEATQFYAALHHAKVPAELHVFMNGSHGFNTRASGAVKNWLKLWQEWVHELGMFD